MRHLKAKYGAGLLVAVLVLVTAASAQAGEITTDKLWDLFYRILNFAVLMVILVYFLKKPTVNFFTNRRETVRAELEELEAKRAEVERAYRESESKMASLEDSAGEIVAEAVRQGELERERILADAERSAENMKRQAEMAVQHELSVVKSQLRTEIAEEAARAAEELVQKNLQPADEDRMIAGCLDKVGGVQ